ncbi:class II fructose-bisphosphate aldolase [Agrococcus sp. TF02-5]|nr:class II fructose-bisphosphate aldolase [Agrococcus sp. TF02-05]
MPLIPTAELLAEARAEHRGLAAFNVLHLESAEAFAAAAEATGLPVVLQLSENCVRRHGALRPIGSTPRSGRPCTTSARRASTSCSPSARPRRGSSPTRRSSGCARSRASRRSRRSGA